MRICTGAYCGAPLSLERQTDPEELWGNLAEQVLHGKLRKDGNIRGRRRCQSKVDMVTVTNHGYLTIFNSN